jgi:hypothetical protein
MSMIVKIQKALFPADSPALIYDKDRTLIIHEPLSLLPFKVRQALAKTPKVYWTVHRTGSDLVYVKRAPVQSW